MPAASDRLVSFLAGVHGTVALVLICALLYVDESGVPLPFAPNELLLIVAGLLISTGGLDPYVFFPLALAAMCGGVLTGYAWARALGPPALRAVAARLHAERHYDRASARLRNATAPTIFIARMLPGVRIYATLVSGAAQVSRRRFMLGAFPAAAVWCFFFTYMGVLFGLPAEHLLSRFQQVAFRAGVLVVLAVASYVAARHVPSDDERPTPLAGVPAAGRYVLAVALDFGMITTIMAGLAGLTRYALQIHRRYALLELAVIAGVVVISYIVVSRRGPGATVGERLLDVTYRKVHLRRAESGRPRDQGTGPGAA